MILNLARADFPAQFGNQSSGESQGPQIEPNQSSPGPSSKEAKSSSSAKREKIWERDIIRDITRFQEFGKKSSKDRGEDKETSRLLSIVTGVIARGRRDEFSDKNILQCILTSIDNEESLKRLFTVVSDDLVRQRDRIPFGVPVPRYWWVSGHQWMSEHGHLVSIETDSQHQPHEEENPTVESMDMDNTAGTEGASPLVESEALATVQRDIDKQSAPLGAEAAAAAPTGPTHGHVPPNSGDSKESPVIGPKSGQILTWHTHDSTSEESEKPSDTGNSRRNRPKRKVGQAKDDKSKSKKNKKEDDKSKG
jgi:hypothetical protein